ncbi:hypothetical protein ACLB2K_036825 [Fragaria x ananassa]
MTELPPDPIDLPDLQQSLSLISRSHHTSLIKLLGASLSGSYVYLVYEFVGGKNISQDILEQLTPMIILHFGGNILSRIGTLFDKYMDALIKALPESSDDDTLSELKEFVPFRAETDSEQLAILGVAFTIVDELLPNAVMNLWKQQSGNVEPKSGPAENVMFSPNTSTEFKDWRRHLQHSFDKLRDHFCRQYVLSFIYSREGKTRLDAQIYISENGDDLYWDSDPLPSLPFQALFAKLQQLATVAGDVLLGKEKIQKILLARLTETVLMWLSDEQEFWSVFENDTCPLQPFGLQQSSLPENPMIYDTSEISSSTNNFLSHRLSSSSTSTSTSWRCTLRGKDAVVFQRKSRTPIDLPDLQQSLSLISRSHHTSLIKLLGASLSGSYVYEFVDGANLADCLRNPNNPSFTVLSSWLSRLQISTDLAHGLDYIHHC